VAWGAFPELTEGHISKERGGGELRQVMKRNRSMRRLLAPAPAAGKAVTVSIKVHKYAQLTSKSDGWFVK
jgi:hypothetical protein